MNIFQRLEKAEHEFKNSEFACPVFSDKVNVDIAGIITQYSILPKDYRGWGIFKPFGNKLAAYEKECPHNLRELYLCILPRFEMVVCDIDKKLGIIINSDTRITTTSPLKFHLSENISLFNHILVRFDGGNFIYEKHSRYYDNKIIARMIYALDNNKKIELLPAKYQAAFDYAYHIKQRELLGQKEYRIKSAIERSGGKYKSYSELSDEDIKVTYEIDGHTYTSTINKNLNVISAGICLSGGDTAFDLQSLMSVIREGQNRNLIHRW